MLSDTLIRAPRVMGLAHVQPRGMHGARELASWRWRLAAGDRATHHRVDEETIVVLQEGAGTFAAGDVVRTVSRASVFSERATAMFVPPGVAFAATATTPLEAILITTPATGGNEPALVVPDDVEVLARGRDGYTREVHNLFVSDGHAERLMVGETFTPAGNWSSFPPHKHDGRNGEPALEEVYHFRINPPQGFGVQLLYTADGESAAHCVRDGDVVVLPYGYHPVSAPPGYDVYYLWALAGAARRLAVFEDPAHRWIHDARRGGPW